jgi:lysozyme
VSDGASQADYFLNTAGDSVARPTLPPAVDLEWNPYDSSQPCYGLSADSMVSWITAFDAEVQHWTGRRPALYTSASWWSLCTGGNSSFAGDPLWVASYDVSDPAIPIGWPSWSLWQYTANGSVPGISGDVDVSNFIGTQNDLHAFAGQQSPVPPPQIG